MRNFFAKIWKGWNALSLVLRIIIGLCIGTVLAIVCPGQGWISVLGTLFVGALKAIAPLLVFVLVASALSRAGKGIGSRFGTLIFCYLLTTVLAAAAAVATGKMFPVDLQLSGATEQAAAGSLRTLFHDMLNSIVANPVTALCEANYLCILFWAVICGIALRVVASPTTIGVVADLADVISKCVYWIIQFAPFGILGLVFTNVSAGGLEIFTTYGKLVLTLVGCMLFVIFVLDAGIAAIVLKGNPFPLLWQCIKDSAVPAFFTRSSAANIPVNMQLCKKMGVENNFYSVAVPLGSTINMNGAAITITIMTMAACHTLGIEVGIGQAIVLSLVSAAAACGTSGVAGGSLLLIPLACSLFGIGQDISMQVVAIGFIIGVIQDSFETALNSSTDAFFIIATEMRDRRKRNQ